MPLVQITLLRSLPLFAKLPVPPSRLAALFVLRFREPSAPRPFRAVGYPLAPAVFILASLAIVINAVYSDPGVTGAGLGVIGAGVPLYVWLTRRQRGVNGSRP